MLCYETLTITALGLVLFVCRSTHSLETGCKYPSDVSVGKDVLYHDLKCTYTFNGLTHMLVTKHLIGPPFFWSLSMVIGKINHYNNFAKSQIHSLYRLNVSMDALWVLHLYMATLQGFYEKSSNKMEDGQKVIAAHDYVIGRLLKDLTECRKDNSFNKWKIISNGIVSEKELIALMDDNVAGVEKLLTKNKHEYIGSSLQIGNLLVNNMGSKYDFIEDLMNVFNVQVEWSRTGVRLKKSWVDARNFFWTTDKFENLKLYYKLSFNFLKIIMFRLSLKHLGYLEPFVGTNILYAQYAKEWYDKVKQFGDMLGLSEDLHVNGLLVALDNLVKKEGTIASVVSYLTAILKTLCLPLGCEATKKFELNDKEFATPYKNPMSRDDCSVRQSPVRIELYSLENTRTLLCYLSWMFRYVDFKLIQLLIEYINRV